MGGPRRLQALDPRRRCGYHVRPSHCRPARRGCTCISFSLKLKTRTLSLQRAERRVQLPFQKCAVRGSLLIFRDVSVESGFEIHSPPLAPHSALPAGASRARSLGVGGRRPGAGSTDTAISASPRVPRVEAAGGEVELLTATHELAPLPSLPRPLSVCGFIRGKQRSLGSPPEDSMQTPTGAVSSPHWSSSLHTGL